MNTKKDKNYRPALLAAGRLAEAAHLVVVSDSFDLSAAIRQLDSFTRAYDKEILKLEDED